MRGNTIASPLFLIALLSGACGPAAPTAQVETPSPSESPVPPPTAAAPVTGAALPVFATYDEPAVSVAPAVVN